MIARIVTVLAGSLFLSGLMLVPVAIIAYVAGARPSPHLLARMVAWGACFLVGALYVVQLVTL